MEEPNYEVGVANGGEPITESKDYKTYMKKYKDYYNPKLQKYGMEIVDIKMLNILRASSIAFILFLLLVLAGAGYGLYLIKDGKLQSNINNTINPSFNASIENNNQYDFNPSTTNNFYNNFTLVFNGEINVNST